MSQLPPQVKRLPARPNLGYLKKLAKERLASLRIDRPSAKLSAAQLAIAREYGFASWKKLALAVQERSTVPVAIDSDTIAALLEAIRLKDLRWLHRNLRDKPDLIRVDTGNGATPLHRAAEFNQPMVVNLLLTAGADPHAKFGRYGHTPLSWAVTVGALDAIDALVQSGVKPDLFCAAGMGDLARVGAFFQDNGLLVAKASQTGSSRYDAAGNLLPCPPTSDAEIIADALYAAARNGHANVVRELLAHGPDLQFRAYIGGTPLHWAHFSGSRETVDLLLDAGADPEARDGEFRCTPRAFGICVSANWGRLESVRQQLAADPSLATIFEGRGTPLHEAARGGNAPIVKMLLEAGADPTVLNSDGQTALAIAEIKRHADVINLLAQVTCAKTDADAFLDAAVPHPDSNHKSGSLEPAKKMLAEQPSLSQSSIFTACACGSVKAVKKFLEADRSLANAAGGVRQWPALCYLTFSRFLRDEKRRATDFVKCAKLLLDAGADPNSYWTTANDPSSKEAALYGAAGIANCAPLTRLLIDSGADVNDHESLYHASEFADNAALRVLLQAKPKNLSYNLCHKMDMEDPAGVKMFIQHGADVNVLLTGGMFKGSRPLHFAIYRRRSLRVFNILLEAGADPKLTDDKGVTPYQLARKLGLNSVAKLLRSKGASDELDPRNELLSALSSGDRKTVTTMLRTYPGLKDELTENDHRLLVEAAVAGNLAAVRLMLDIGFPIDVRGNIFGGWDATALDQAAWHGHAAIVRLLLKLGADPSLKHGFGGDALGAAIHGASHGDHSRGVAAVKALAAIASDKRLDAAIDYARTEPNERVIRSLAELKQERTVEGTKINE